MEQQTIYDILGIGIGPFNLGLAALSAFIPELQCIFFDQMPEFNWHPGLMIDHAHLQVPFLADLVTLADPRSPFTYVCFLKAMNRLTRFAIHENYYPSRKEYNAYCHWVAGQLRSLHFSSRCEAIKLNAELKSYEVHIEDLSTGVNKMFYAKHIVIGVGTSPHVPGFVKSITQPNIFHSSDYLFHKNSISPNSKITIVGSGQSAAEIFYDLLQSDIEFDSLHWYTRSDRFYPMEYSKLTLEMTSPDYIDYFYGLNDQKKEQILKGQNNLYKGINFILINDIYDALYARSQDGNSKRISLYTNCELKNISVISDNLFRAEFHHTQKDRTFSTDTNMIILATGYKNIIPGFLDPVKELIRFKADGMYDVQKNYSVDQLNSIFVQNADLHSHGFNSADLGMGPYRNGVILNTILGRDYIKLERNIAFQDFDIPLT